MNRKLSLIALVTTILPIATIVAWLWAGMGYVKQVEINTDSIRELKVSVQKADEFQDSIRVDVGALKVECDMLRQELLKRDQVNNAEQEKF